MKKYWKQLTLGLVLGSFMGTAFGWWSWVHVHSMRHPPEKKWERKMNRFSRKLDLSGQQQVQVATIFKNKHKIIVSLHAEMAPRFQQIHRTAIIEITAVLNPVQQQRFEELEARRAKWREKYASRHRNPFGYPVAHLASYSPDY